MITKYHVKSMVGILACLPSACALRVTFKLCYEIVLWVFFFSTLIYSWLSCHNMIEAQAEQTKNCLYLCPVLSLVCFAPHFADLTMTVHIT